VWGRPLEFGKLSWPEVARAAAQERVAIVPVGTLEDHGHHLPIDTDVTLVEAICRGAAERLTDRTVLLPAIVHGYSPHHMDFPGTITIGWDTFTRYCTDVSLSLVRHGFKRVLMVNGHGSNQNLVETAARLTMVEEPGSLVAATFYLVTPKSAETIAATRTSTRGGMAHACELETSIYLHLHPEAVDMAAAVDERGYPETEDAWLDWSDGPLKLMPWWSSFSETGVQGDATLATPPRGRSCTRRPSMRSPLSWSNSSPCRCPPGRIIMALKGKPLPPGGTIGVPAPAWPYQQRSDLLRGIEWWESRGYKVKLAEGIYHRHGYVAGSPEQRGKDITAMFADDDVDFVQCYDGGFGSAHAIPHIDFDVVRANPKPFMGYSDITALHVALHHHTGLVTFYGPLFTTPNHPKTKDFTRDSMMRALTHVGALGDVPRNPEDDYLRAFNGGKVTAELVGGCLWLLGQTIGTPWQIDPRGRILFFEDVQAPPWYVDGLLTQMVQAGILADVAGIVIGEMTQCDWTANVDHDWPGLLSTEDIFEQHLEPLGVPMLYGLPLGHGDHLATIPLGVTVTLDADSRKLTIDEPALEV
jgi:muramoyltetrapeptide carboxypeptidase